MTTKELYDAQHLNTVRLYGVLGARFGRVHRLAVGSTAEAVRALCVLYKGFEQFLMESRDRGMGFAVFLGKTNVGEEHLLMNTQQDIRIAPILMGSKNGGIFSIILGAALIGVSFLIPGAGMLAAGLFNAGLAMALGGVVQLLSPQPKDRKSKDKPENEPNYAFNGPINTEAQGNCVPVAYGRPWTGSAVVSAGIQSDDVYVPVKTPLDLTDWLLLTNPEFLYPLQNGDYSDATGHHATLVPFNNYTDGDGITFFRVPAGGNNSTGTLQATTGALTGGLDHYTVLFRVRLDSTATTSGVSRKFLFGHVSNSLSGFYEWAFQMSFGNEPQAIINHMGGAGYSLTSPTPLAAGSEHVVGFRQTGPLFQLFVGNTVVASRNDVAGSFGGSALLCFCANTFAGGAGWAVGYQRSLTDDEYAAVATNIANGHAGSVTAGEGDGNVPEEV